MVDIILSCNNSAEIYKIPVLPSELPEVSTSISNNTLATNDKVLTILGNVGNGSFPFEFMVPEYEGKYRWQRSWHYDNPKEYYDWIISVAKRKIPLRMVVFDGFNEFMNIALAIENISYQIDRQKDLHIKCQFSEFEFVG